MTIFALMLGMTMQMNGQVKFVETNRQEMQAGFRTILPQSVLGFDGTTMIMNLSIKDVAKYAEIDEDLLKEYIKAQPQSFGKAFIEGFIEEGSTLVDMVDIKRVRVNFVDERLNVIPGYTMNYLELLKRQERVKQQQI